MTLGGCPLSIFCSRGTPPRIYHEPETVMVSQRAAVLLASAVDRSAFRADFREHTSGCDPKDYEPYLDMTASSVSARKLN